MYVRWSERKRNRGGQDLPPTWYARLVECKRVKVGGKSVPHQQTVAYLGSIDSARLDDSAERVRFWVDVEEGILRSWKRINPGYETTMAPAFLNRIAPVLTGRVPRPAAAELDVVRRTRAGPQKKKRSPASPFTIEAA